MAYNRMTKQYKGAKLINQQKIALVHAKYSNQWAEWFHPRTPGVKISKWRWLP